MSRSLLIHRRHVLNRHTVKRQELWLLNFCLSGPKTEVKWKNPHEEVDAPHGNLKKPHNFASCWDDISMFVSPREDLGFVHGSFYKPFSFVHQKEVEEINRQNILSARALSKKRRWRLRIRLYISNLRGVFWRRSSRTFMCKHVKSHEALFWPRLPLPKMASRKQRR